jgi:phage recombination protein Bet
MEDNKQVIVAEKITEDKLMGWMKTAGVASNLSEKEKVQFMEIAVAYQLNPFKREIYCNAYGEGQYRNLSIITGYEVYLKRAERTNDLSGWHCETSGSIESKDLKAIITIHRNSWKHPFIHEVEYAEYVQHKKDGTVTKFWADKPKTMIKKVAMAQGFRLAFPDELGGMPYTADELHLEPVVEVEVIKKTPIPVSTLGIKEPQRKSASEPTAEQLKAMAALKAKEYHKDEPVKEDAKVEPSASQTPSDDLKSATGLIVTHIPANRWGYVVVCLEGFQKEDGKDIPFTTKNPELVKVLDSIPDGQKVHLEYKVVVNAKGYTNYYIENALEVVPF